MIELKNLLTGKVTKGLWRKIIALLLCAVMAFGFSGCDSYRELWEILGNMDVPMEQRTGTEEEFEEFVELLAKDMLESSYITTHVMLENPEEYGIDKSKCPLELSAHFDDSSWEADVMSIEIMENELKRYNPENFSDELKGIYYYLDYFVSSSLELYRDEFRYYGCAFEPMTGIHAQLPSLFSEWEFRTEQDIKDLITIMEDVPAYIDSLLEYTAIQVERGEWVGDSQDVAQFCKDIIAEGEDYSALKAMLENIKAVELSSEKLDEYTQKITDTFMGSVIPAYEAIAEAMENIDESSQIQGSLSELEYGREYYEALFYSLTGLEDDVEQVLEELDQMKNEAMYQLSLIIYEHPEFLNSLGEDIDTGFESYDEIIEFLKEKYQQDFPYIDFPQYEADPLEEDLQVDGIVAYFVTPPYDYSSSMQIKVNTSSASDVGSMGTFTTLAHEGVPGHMYQIAYSYENLSIWNNLLCGVSGFTEGYATYVELFSINYLSGIPEITQDELNFWRTYNIFNYLTIAYLDIQINYNGWDLSDVAAELGYSSGQEETIEPLYQQIRCNPGAFLPYYIGFMEFYKLRSQAEDALGSSFDNYSFHQAILKSGSVPFSLVEENVYDYIGAGYTNAGGFAA